MYCFANNRNRKNSQVFLLQKVVSSRMLFLLLLVLNTTLGYSQEERSLKVIGTVESDYKGLSNAKVTLLKNGKSDKTVTTGSDGVFSFEMEMNNEYLIEIARSGMLSKKIAFNTEIPDDVIGKWTMEFAMTLFEGCEGVNTSALNDPVDRVKFSTNKNDFISDKAYVERMRGRIGQMMYDIENCQQEEYQKAMNEGDKLMNSGQYEEARTKYQEALVMFPNDREAEKGIAEINKKIGVEKKSEQEYNDLISEADQLYAVKEYDEAKEKYNEALQVMPQNSYPSEKIASINKMKAADQQAAQKQQQYDKYIAQANVAFNAQNYTGAKEYYQQALMVKPDATLPKQKIAEMEPIMAQQQQNAQAQQAKEKSYQEAMAMGQSAMQSGDYEAAKQHFNRALVLQPNQSLPKTKIIEAEKAIEAKYIADMQAQKVAAQQQFDAILDEGDNYFDQKNYVAALAAYQKAMEINPKDTYVKQRFNRTNSLLDAEAADKQKALEQAYASSIEQGDALVAAGSFQQGIQAYNQALVHKPNDSQALAKISQAEQQQALQQNKLANEQAKKQQYDQYLLQGNNLIAAGQYAQAKASYQNALSLYPEQSVPRTKMAEADRLIAEQQKEDQYKQTIATADGMLAAKSYTQAKAAYQQALSVKAGDEYASQKINEINGILLGQQQAAAENQARLAQYTILIQQGDNLFNASQLQEARNAYQQALNIQPTESYPTAQISKIDAQLAEQLRLENEQKARAQQYSNLITKADGQLSVKDYAGAKTSYQQALAIKSSEAYPQQKIAEIDGILTREKQQAAEQQARNEQYNQLVTQGDNLMAAAQLEQAKTAYQSALAIKPAESYPTAQITKIDAQVAERTRLESEERARNLQYQQLVSKADGQFNAKDYSGAKTTYQQAIALKATEAYPQQKIAEIEALILSQQQLAAAQKARDDQYNQIIREADNFYAAKKLDEAKASYQKALAVKSSEAYPVSQISKIDAQIAENLRLEQEKIAKKAQEYNDAVAQANAYFSQDQLDEAKAAYQRALVIKPGESYPSSQISKIDGQLALREKERQEKLAFEQKYQSIIASADIAYDKRDYPSAKTSYSEALQMKPMESYPQQQLNQIADFERIIAQQEATRNAAIAAAGTASAATATSTPKTTPKGLSELNFSNDSEMDKYLNGLKKSYPEGVSLEVYKEKNKTTKRYVVIRNDEAREFREVRFSWGGVDFSQNGKPITSQYFNSQVKVREGEFFQEIK